MKYLLALSLCFCSLLSKADNPISGNTVVVPGSVETYTVNWDSWG